MNENKIIGSSMSTAQFIDFFYVMPEQTIEPAKAFFSQNLLCDEYWFQAGNLIAGITREFELIEDFLLLSRNAPNILYFFSRKEAINFRVELDKLLLNKRSSTQN